MNLPVKNGFYRKRTHSNVLVERPELGHNLTGQAFLYRRRADLISRDNNQFCPTGEDILDVGGGKTNF